MQPGTEHRAQRECHCHGRSSTRTRSGLERGLSRCRCRCRCQCRWHCCAVIVVLLSCCCCTHLASTARRRWCGMSGAHQVHRTSRRTDGCLDAYRAGKAEQSRAVQVSQQFAVAIGPHAYRQPRGTKRRHAKPHPAHTYVHAACQGGHRGWTRGAEHAASRWRCSSSGHQRVASRTGYRSE